MLKYTDYYNKVGIKYSIVNGDLVEDEQNGIIVVSDYIKDYSIYVNKLTGEAKLVIPKNSYVGKIYKLKVDDCITLSLRWADENKNTNFQGIYKQLKAKKFVEYYNMDLSNTLLDKHLTGNYTFREVSNLELGDFIVYKLENHLGVYLGNGKILHHLPKKLSCIDNIDSKDIIRIFRYA